MFNLFGGKKKDKGFYLELDEKKVSEPVAKEAATAAPAPAAEIAPAPATEEKESKPPQSKKTKKTSAKQAKAPKAEAGKPEPVAVAPAPAKSEPAPGNFATEYLVVQTRSRRRPGPSLNQFKEMARQAKVPRG